VVERRFGGYGQQLAEGFRAEDLVDALGRPATGGAWSKRMRGGEQLEVLFRMDEGVVGHQRGDVGQFGRLGAQKFAPCGGIEKEILNGDRGSGGQGGVFDAQDLAAGNFDARAGVAFPDSASF
jgi:hypothetical protein